MMEYISTISYFFTNEMRLFLGLFLVAKVMNFRPKKNVTAFCLRLAVFW